MRIQFGKAMEVSSSQSQLSGMCWVLWEQVGLCIPAILLNDCQQLWEARRLLRGGRFPKAVWGPGLILLPEGGGL